MPLRYDLLPMMDYVKAKRLFWDPENIDLSEDVRQWPELSEEVQLGTLRLIAGFYRGEIAVTEDLSPLLFAVRKEGGHLEDEIFLCTQLFEEAKHTEFFDRWLNTVVPGVDLNEVAPVGPHYQFVFYEELPRTLHQLYTDQSRRAQLEAVATYHLMVEGVAAEAGYATAYLSLKERGLLPGLVKGFELIQRDEARHIAFGHYLAERIIRDDPDLLPVAKAQMRKLFPHILGLFLFSQLDVIKHCINMYETRLRKVEESLTGAITPEAAG